MILVATSNHLAQESREFDITFTRFGLITCHDTLKRNKRALLRPWRGRNIGALLRTQRRGSVVKSSDKSVDEEIIK